MSEPIPQAEEQALTLEPAISKLLIPSCGPRMRIRLFHEVDAHRYGIPSEASRTSLTILADLHQFADAHSRQALR